MIYISLVPAFNVILLFHMNRVPPNAWNVYIHALCSAFAVRLLCVTQLQLLLCRLRSGNKSACICAIIISALLPLSLRSIDFSLIHALFKRRELESSSAKKSVPLSFVRRIQYYAALRSERSRWRWDWNWKVRNRIGYFQRKYTKIITFAILNAKSFRYILHAPSQRWQCRKSSQHTVRAIYSRICLCLLSYCALQLSRPANDISHYKQMI